MDENIKKLPEEQLEGASGGFDRTNDDPAGKSKTFEGTGGYAMAAMIPDEHIGKQEK